MVHTVIYNYMQLLNKQIARKQEMMSGNEYQMDFKSRAAKSRSELIAQLRDACVHILHTHDGARLAMNCLWHGTKKDRKVTYTHVYNIIKFYYRFLLQKERL